MDDALSGRIPFVSESVANYESIDTFGADGIRRNGLASARTAYLRESTELDVRRHPSFKLTKGLPHASWYWRPELADRIPYTIRCIESLPYRAVGLVRAFFYKNTFMPTHRDTIPDADGNYDRRKALGISLVPTTGQVGLRIWDDEKRKAVEFKGNALLFDDSKWHGVPMTTGLRITLRIFGDLELDLD